MLLFHIHVLQEVKRNNQNSCLHFILQYTLYFNYMFTNLNLDLSLFVWSESGIYVNISGRQCSFTVGVRVNTKARHLLTALCHMYTFFHGTKILIISNANPFFSFWQMVLAFALTRSIKYSIQKWCQKSRIIRTSAERR